MGYGEMYFGEKDEKYDTRMRDYRDRILTFC